MLREGRGLHWNDKHRRCYQRIRLGLERHRSCKRLRFLTLTSVPGQTTDIGSAFNNLNREIHHLTGEKLVRLGYLTSNQARYYYGKNQERPFVFSFLRVRTDEGYQGVFHILFFGQFIPRRWIADAWQRLLGVPRMSEHSVDIRECRQDIRSPIRLARYCVSQYVAGQNKYVKFYQSKGWLYRGWKNDYDYCRRHYRRYRTINAEEGSIYAGSRFDSGLRNIWNEFGYFELSFNQFWTEFCRKKVFRQDVLPILDIG